MKTVNFGMDDKFCDENNLRNSWKIMQKPPEFSTFFSIFFNIDIKILNKFLINESDINESEKI